jgi:hypothetical protein
MCVGNESKDHDDDLVDTDDEDGMKKKKSTAKGSSSSSSRGNAYHACFCCMKALFILNRVDRLAFWLVSANQTLREKAKSPI